MNILMISTDRKIFDKNSAVNNRMVEYGNLAGELHIIVFTSGPVNLNRQKISDNTWIYPTNSKNRWLYVFDAIKIGKKIRNIDLVTTQDPFETGIAGWRLVRAYGARLQLQIHTDFLSPYFIKGNMLNKIRVRISRFLLPKADNVRVVSERIKSSLIKSGIIKDWTKIVVLPIFVDIDSIRMREQTFELHKRYPQFDFIILVTSRLSEEKNISLAIDAFKKVKEKYSKTGLVIVGEGIKRKALMQQAVNYKLQSSIIFEPWSDDIISYYKTSDLFLNTSNYEGYGLTLIEAVASECPVATTNVGIVGDIINKNNVLICNVGDSDCITGKIILAMENKAIRERLTKDALKAISKISISKENYLEEHKKTWENI